MDFYPSGAISPNKTFLVKVVLLRVHHNNVKVTSTKSITNSYNQSVGELLNTIKKSNFQIIYLEAGEECHKIF